MNLNTLPREIVTRCFSYLSAELLTNIILLESIPDNIVQAAAENLYNLWYSDRIRGFEREMVECSDAEAYYETDFDRFLRILKNLEEKSFKCPLLFHYTWNNIFEMHQDLDEIYPVYNGQKLGIHADIEDEAFQIYPIFPSSDINLKINYLSLRDFSECCIDLNNFPKLETFYGSYCKISVDHDHPSLKYLYLNGGSFRSLPINLIELVAKSSWIEIDEDHPKLEALKVLILEEISRRLGWYSLLRLLWNENLETFSCIARYEDESRIEYEIFSLLGPKMTCLGFSGSISPRVPRLLRSLYSINGESLEILTAFTHMTSLTLKHPTDNFNSFELPPSLLSLTLHLPKGEIDKLKLPLNLLKLSIKSAKFEDLSKMSSPPNWLTSN